VATLKVYARQLWQVQRSVCEKLGVQIAWAPLDQRAMMLSGDVTLAMLIKILTDKGVITDQELLTLADQVKAAVIPPLAISVSPDEDGAMPDPDLGS
jgi:hypothetical protein